ncbi:hypothetical protein ACWF9B_01685 [Streptomyces sp. NPDC055089]
MRTAGRVRAAAPQARTGTHIALDSASYEAGDRVRDRFPARGSSPEAVRDGICGACRGKPADAPGGPVGAVPVQGVRARMSAVRAGLVPRAERTYR